MKFAVVVVLAGFAAACGRIGFEPRAELDGDGSVITDDSRVTVDDASDDATDADLTVTCAGGDSVCRISCLATDPDCTSTCGDSTCVGNAGELCANCAECDTTAPVCGNGACDPGEDSDVCYADCGPTPWMWTAEEADVVMRINTARTAGIDCGPGGPVVLPALTLATSLSPGSREWAWELAHHQLAPSGPTSCNGRSLATRLADAGTTGAAGAALYAGSAQTPQNAVTSWIATPSLCAILVDPAHTRIGVGVAYDATRGFAIILD